MKLRFLTFNIIIKINVETNIISVCFKPELKVMILYWGSQHRVRVPLGVPGVRKKITGFFVICLRGTIYNLVVHRGDTMLLWGYANIKRLRIACVH